MPVELSTYSIGSAKFSQASMPLDTLDIHSSCLVSKALAHCLVPGALQHDLSSAQQGSMPLAHATPLFDGSAQRQGSV